MGLVDTQVPRDTRNLGEFGRTTSKAKYSLPPIVNQYREGKVKRTPGGE